MYAVVENKLKVALKPLSHPELDEILIEESLFPIGRNEVPFSAYPRNLVTSLSRRHARLFEENSRIYLADLGSQNGTTVNGKSINNELIELHTGDKICFAGTLVYQVDVSQHTSSPENKEHESLPICVTLVPQQTEIGLEPIVISQFPFLIGKKNELFLQYKHKYPQEVNFISRRHAHFFLKNEDLYIEDLGSTNGTFVSGERLDEHAKQLKNGDIIAFGGNHFVYTVTINRRNSERKITSPASAALCKDTEKKLDSAPSKTTFVASATSFLDIFCVAGEESQDSNHSQANEDHDSDSNPEASAAKRSSAPIIPKWLRKARIFFSELRDDLNEKESQNRKRRWIILAISIGVFTLVISTYLIGNTQSELKELVEKGHYNKATSLANQYLAEHPEDKKIQNLATESLLKSILPNWIAQLDKHSFAETSKILARARDNNQFNSDVLSMLELLDWIGDLERFIYERGGLDASIAIYKHENLINTLVEYWESNRIAHRRLMAQILTFVPEFEPIYNRTFSALRALRNEKATYITAIEELKANIKKKLNTNQAKELKPIFENFIEKYPNISGIENLQSDLNKYLEIQSNMSSTNKIQLSRRIETITFTTPPFKDKLAELQTTIMPPPEINAQFQRASEAWQSGKLRKALSLLKNITNGEWGQLAAQRLQRNTQILRDFLDLKESKRSDNYKEHLFTFYNSLNPEEDVYFYRLLAKDFRHHKEKAMLEVQKKIAKARQSWATYLEGGGIEGIHRLEPKISDDFKHQARLLTQAYNHLTEVRYIYNLIQLNYPSEAEKLFQKVNQEIKLQRQSLKELSMVLEDDLLESKLQLIVDPSATRRK